jgi:hypothetical protein
MKELGMNPRSASLASGLNATAIRELVRKPGLSPKMETVRKLAEGLDTTPEWLAYGIGDPTSSSKELVLRPHHEPPIAGSATQIPNSLFVRAAYGGVVEAGSFREVDEVGEPEQAFFVEMADREYPDVPLITFTVAGDSMNDLKPHPLLPGQRVVCLDFEGLKNRVPLRDGMVVVVEQTTGAGHLRERSVKQIELYRDRTEFCPRSTNPKHKPIVVPYQMEPDDGREVRILGIVRRVTIDMPGW